MTPQTPEPWGIEDTGDDLWVGPMRKDGGGKIASIVFHICMEGILEESKARDRANAARIVACVNSLAGINPDAVQQMVKALEDIQQLGLGPDQGTTAWQAESAHEIASVALAAARKVKQPTTQTP